MVGRDLREVRGLKERPALRERLELPEPKGPQALRDLKGKKRRLLSLLRLLVIRSPIPIRSCASLV
jgi:hypothetical protein